MAKHTGTPMQAKTLGAGLFGNTLWRMAQKLPPNERIRPKEDPKVATAKANAKKAKQDVTDEQLAECRRAFEAGEKDCKQLAREHGVSYDRMYRLVNYQTRSSWRSA